MLKRVAVPFVALALLLWLVIGLVVNQRQKQQDQDFYYEVRADGKPLSQAKNGCFHVPFGTSMVVVETNRDYAAVAQRPGEGDAKVKTIGFDGWYTYHVTDLRPGKWSLKLWLKGGKPHILRFKGEMKRDMKKIPRKSPAAAKKVCRQSARAPASAGARRV